MNTHGPGILNERRAAKQGQEDGVLMMSESHKWYRYRFRLRHYDPLPIFLPGPGPHHYSGSSGSDLDVEVHARGPWRYVQTFWPDADYPYLTEELPNGPVFSDSFYRPDSWEGEGSDGRWSKSYLQALKNNYPESYRHPLPGPNASPEEVTEWVKELGDAFAMVSSLVGAGLEDSPEKDRILWGLKEIRGDFSDDE